MENKKIIQGCGYKFVNGMRGWEINKCLQLLTISVTLGKWEKMNPKKRLENILYIIFPPLLVNLMALGSLNEEIAAAFLTLP